MLYSLYGYFQSMSQGSKKAYFELITGSVLFGLLGVFVEYLKDVPTGPMIFYKQFFGLVSLLIFIVLTGKLSQIVPRRKKKYILLLGFINTCTIFSYFTCIKYTSFSVAILMLYTAPMYVTLLSPLVLKEKITRKGVVALILSLTGLLFIVNIGNVVTGISLGINGNNGYLIGIAAGILSGLSFGSEIVTIRYIKDDYSSVALLFWYTFIGVILLIPLSGGVPQPVIIDNMPMLIFFGIINTAIAALLYVSGISQIEAQKGSILALLEPVSGIFFDYTIVHTPLLMNTIIGCVFILFGAYIAVMEKSPKIFGKYFKIQV
ncbi:Permease of the drug/metabolite transporter (DMT) superfamily [Methanolobus vulcani]|uniref:Permease of the drug/metabolite transporter (DMT) superfamily n=2 Tax=Methanolobus vulcani TaxID=38026 RepID=A0A7Z7FDB4_9EURY|nr:Permease of the drug/metabolite transporter (DMT) superfamily [Methanolobus vulcani]